MSDPYDWQVHIEREWQHMGQSRVIIFRRSPNRAIEVMTGLGAGGDAIFTRYEDGAQVTERGILLPTAALHAIADTLKPGPDSAELGRVVEALTVERARVDRILDR